jgi:hypothetical protein
MSDQPCSNSIFLLKSVTFYSFRELLHSDNSFKVLGPCIVLKWFSGQYTLALLCKWKKAFTDSSCLGTQFNFIFGWIGFRFLPSLLILFFKSLRSGCAQMMCRPWTQWFEARAYLLYPHSLTVSILSLLKIEDWSRHRPWVVLVGIAEIDSKWEVGPLRNSSRAECYESKVFSKLVSGRV